MIKLFVTVDLHAENGEPLSHTFCFNYGESKLENFTRAAQDYIHNYSSARYVELNVEGQPLYRADIVKAVSAEDSSSLQSLLQEYQDISLDVIPFPLEKTG